MRPLLMLLGLLCIALLLTEQAPASPALDYFVTKFEDTNDGNCAPDDCSLREAIIAANNHPGIDTILMWTGTYSLTIGGVNEDFSATGDLDIRDGVVISGAGAGLTVIDASSIDRVFHVVMGASDVTMSGVEIRGGSLREDSARTGGGIYNAGTMTLIASTVVSNSVGSFGPSNGHGGGIYNIGTLTLITGTVGWNAVGVTGMTYTTASGGGIENGGNLEIRDSLIAHNRVSAGYYVHDPGLEGKGGGVANHGRLVVTNSTISGNRVNVATWPWPSSNRAEGGGLWASSWSSATLNNVTITNNEAMAFGGRGGGDGIYGNVTVGNTLIGNNAGPDCYGTLNSLDYNLLGWSLGCTITGTVTHNIYGQSPRLQALADNGGPTWTHGLCGESPAINAGSPTTCTSADQRGVARPQGPHCDIGAYELILDFPPLPTPTPPASGHRLYVPLIRNVCY